MEKKFAICIRNHNHFGVILTPYLIIKEEEETFYHISEPVLKSYIYKIDYAFSKAEKELVSVVTRYNDNQMRKLFSKAKSYREFVRQINDELLTDHIRPYIDRTIEKAFEIIRKNDFPVFVKERKSKILYEQAQLIVHKKSAEAVFNFTKTPENTLYHLSIRHNNSETNLLNRRYQIITNSPCNIIIGNEIFHFDKIDSKKLKPFFSKKHIIIPRNTEKKYYSTFIFKAIKHYRVNAKGFDIEFVNPKRRAILSLEKNWESEYVLILKFLYGKKEYLPNDNTKIYLNLKTEHNGSGTKYCFKKLIRDMDWENSCINTLKELGLSLRLNSNFKVIKTLADKSNNVTEVVEWVNKHQGVLKEKGFEIVQNRSERKYFTDKVHLEYKINRYSRDWFDVYAMVKFGGFSVPFIRLRSHILSGKREYKLPNNEIVILPEEWFAEFKDLMLFGEEVNDEIRLQAHHFSILEDTEKYAQVDTSYLKRFHEETHKIETKAALPKELKAKLRSYQHVGYSWMYSLTKNQFGGCLADDMGLGKTVQSLALLLKVKQQEKQNGNRNSHPKAQKTNKSQLSIFDAIKEANSTLLPADKTTVPASLIIMPTSLIHNWEEEIKKFAPTLSVYRHYGADRKNNINNFDDFDVILTSYGTVRNDFELLSQYQFLFVILDESQYIKNPNSKTYKAVSQLDTQYRMVLTGTPIENSLTDLWSQLNFVNQGLLGSLTFFKNEFVTPIEKYEDELQQERLKKIIQPFVLRRTKNEVEKDLPERTELVRWCTMSEDQRHIYEEEKSKIRNKLIDLYENNMRNQVSFYAFKGLMKLRQIANHPIMADTGYTGESGKFNEIIRHIEGLQAEKNHKVLIFSSFVKHLNLFAKYFKKNDMPFSTLTGEMSSKKRKQAISDFNHNPDNRFFLISIKAGGVGLNLTAADYVFIIDPWWNPAVENQAINRAHRIGQDKKVFVYRFIGTDTVEEKIQTLQQKKSELADCFINTNNPFEKMSIEDIASLFD